MSPESGAPARAQAFPSPLLFMLLMAPFGVASGYLTITLGFQLTQHAKAMSTSDLSELVAISLLPHTWRWLWAPLVDTTWTRKRWYVFGTALCAGGICATGFLAGRPDPSFGSLAVLQVVYNVGATLLAMAIESLFAATVPDEQRGRAAGWFQAGNLGGQGIGGGLALLLVETQGWSSAAAASALAVMSGLCCLALLPLPDPPPAVPVDGRLEAASNLGLRANAQAVVRDLWRVVRSRVGVLAIVICFLPIGCGAAQNLWSAISDRWQADAGTVALVNGAMAGVLSAVGCVVGGWICDRLRRRVAYCLFGLLLSATAVAMALMPHTSAQFVLWTSVYAFVVGLCYAAFSAVVFEAIGTTAAATKYSLLAALSNTPIAYMTLVDGQADAHWHDPNALLYADAASGVLGVVAFPLVALALRGLLRAAERCVLRIMRRTRRSLRGAELA